MFIWGMLESSHFAARSRGLIYSYLQANGSLDAHCYWLSLRNIFILILSLIRIFMFGFPQQKSLYDRHGKPETAVF